MGADLGAAAGLIALVVVGGLVTLVLQRRARDRRDMLARERHAELTRNAVAAVHRGHADRLSDQARELARAWFLEQYARHGDESDKQHLEELEKLP